MDKKKQDKSLVNVKKTIDKDKYHNEKGKFKEGNPGGPGYPKGTKNYLTRLEEALEKYRKDYDRDLFDRFVERAFRSDKVLIAALKKFVPDMEKTEITGNLTQNIDLSGLSTEEIKDYINAYTIKNKPAKRRSNIQADADRSSKT